MQIPHIQQRAFEQALDLQSEWPIPASGMGRMAELACWFAARQGKAIPDDLNAAVVLFAADHALAFDTWEAGDGADTIEQMRLIADGRSAVNLLAADAGAEVRLVDVGVIGDTGAIPGVEHAKINHGCGDIVREAAMNVEEYWQAVGIGEEMAGRVIASGANLLIAGEVGRGSEIAATAVICQLTGLLPEDALGARVSAHGSRAMIAVEEALARADGVHSHEVLRELGGYEIAAMAGAYRAAARHGVPILLDGLASAAAALAAAAWDVRIAGWMLAGDEHGYPGHRKALDELGLEPLARLKLEMGQGVGALAVLPMLQAAIRLHRNLPLRERTALKDERF